MGIIQKITIKLFLITFAAILLGLITACGKAYKATPLPIQSPSSFTNSTEVEGAIIGAKAFSDPEEAKEAFGFDIRGAGMLPVQVVFDNRGNKTFQINPSQTFLEDNEGNLWPILSREIAQERVTKYSQTKNIFKEGAYGGFLGGAAGAVIGAAIGVVSGDDVASTAGKGAAVGAAAGASAGGIKGYASADEARKDIINDLKSKELEYKEIVPNGMSYGFLFFPGEAKSVKQLRLQIQEMDSSDVHTLVMIL